MFTVYILYSNLLSRYYIGFTGDDPGQRLKEHLLSKGHFTSKAKDWVVVYTEKHSTKDSAMRRERQIKNWKSRKMIEYLIHSTE